MDFSDVFRCYVTPETPCIFDFWYSTAISFAPSGVLCEFLKHGIAETVYSTVDLVSNPPDTNDDIRL